MPWKGSELLGEACEATLEVKKWKRMSGKAQPTQKEGVSINSALSVVASIFTLIAAFIAIYGGVQPWVSALLSLFIALVMGVLVWRPLSLFIERQRRRHLEARTSQELRAEALEIASRLQEQMEFRTDSLASNLFGLNQSGIFAEQFAPHPARAQIALRNMIKLLEESHRGRESLEALLALFDMQFALFHEHHVKIPAERASKHKSDIRQHELDQIRKSWPRYEALLEDHRRLCSKAEKTLGLHLGVWCHEVPTPL